MIQTAKMENGEIDMNCFKQPTDLYIRGGSNRLGTIQVHATELKVLLLLRESPKCQDAIHALEKAGYGYDLVASAVEGLQLLSSRHHQIMVIDESSLPQTSSLEDIAKEVQSKFADGVVLMAIVKSAELENTSRVKTLTELGYSRLLQSVDKLVPELVMVESNELELRARLQFAEALFEATEHCSDAVEIVTMVPSAKQVYANKSHECLLGYDEDLTVQQDGTAKRKFECDGESRRRQSKHTFTVHNAYNEVIYQVSLRPHQEWQRFYHSRTSSVGSRHGRTSMGTLSQTQEKVEAPILKVIKLIQNAQDNNDCSIETRNILDNTIEMLRKVPDVYTPNLEENEPSHRSSVTYGGILKNNPRRHSQFFVEPSRGGSLHSPHHTVKKAVAISLPMPSKISEALQNLQTWDYNILELEAVSMNQPLYYLGIEVLTGWFRVDEYLQVDKEVIKSWLQLMESNYHRSNTYHNSTHAADVLQAGAYLLQKLIDRGDMWEPLEMASVLISMVVHDLDHPGRTNNFLSNTRNQLAILYNDRSILENHHVATAFKLTTEKSEANIFANLDVDMYQSVRQSMVEMVLATDMAKHFEHLAKFSAGVTSQTSEIASSSATSIDADHAEMDLMIKRVLIKTADLANPARPMPMCKEWAERISKEYFKQTNEEKRLNLPIVMPAFDETTCNFPQTQVQFIDIIASGLFESWSNFVEIPEIVSQLESNYKFWKSMQSSDS